MLQGAGFKRADSRSNQSELVRKDTIMSLQDGISDMLTRVKNACTALNDEVKMPTSRIKVAIAGVLKEEGYISDYFEREGRNVTKDLIIILKYSRKKPVIEGMKRVSKPSCRIYCNCDKIPRVRNGFGTVILSTPVGVISGEKARENKVGGEVLCYVW